MLKKVGLVTIGAAATLAAVAPIASATDTHEGPEHHGPQGGGKACVFNGGDAGALSEIGGDSAANVVLQGPVGGNNLLNLANCSEFLNNNLNDNLSGNTFAIL